MKKWIVLLALCLCLNGLAAVAEAPAAPVEVSQLDPEPVPVFVEEAPPANTDVPAVPEGGEEPSGGDGDVDAPDPTQGDPLPTDADPPAEPEGDPADPDNPPIEPGEGDGDDPADPEDGDAPEGDDGDAPAVGEAWYVKDGEMVFGSLAELIAQFRGGETVYLRQSPLTLPHAPLKKLAGIIFGYDSDVFTGGDYVIDFALDGEKIDQAALGDRDENETGAMTFTVRKMDQTSETEDGPGEEPEEEPAETPLRAADVQIGVTAEGYVDGQWVNSAPFFTLSGLPDEEGWTYAAYVNGESVSVAGNTFMASQEGAYALSFAIVNGKGAVQSQSETYNVMVDKTPPEDVSIEVDKTKNYTINITAKDSLSGVVKVSPDGGNEWLDLSNDKPFTRTYSSSYRFAAGDIQVRDAAGNVFVSEEEYVLEKVTDDTDPKLVVEPVKYLKNQWTNQETTFALSVTDGGDQSWSYWADMLNERSFRISSEPYKPEEGEHYLCFRIKNMNESGREIYDTATYHVKLDWTAPETVSIAADTTQDYTITITASDSLSGVEAVSLDGGKTWEYLSDGETFTKTYDEATKLAKGAIQIRDAAGNVYLSEKSYSLTKASSGDGLGVGGTGSSGDKKKEEEHARGDGVDEGEYGRLTLKVQDGPMGQLIMGGEVLPVTLTLERADAPGAPVGRGQFFTAALGHWGAGWDNAEPDTLILTAQQDGDLGDAFAYAWHFNGEVTHRLYDSGIRYLALRVGDDVIGLDTEGFLAGTRYDELKMDGVSNRRFNFTFTMQENLNPGYISAMYENDRSQSCDMSIRAEVEDIIYELSNSPHSLMYYHNVYLGPRDMLGQPFGA